MGGTPSHHPFERDFPFPKRDTKTIHFLVSPILETPMNDVYPMEVS